MRHLVRLACLLVLSITLATGTSAVLSAPANAKLWVADTNPGADPTTNLDEFEDRILVRVNRARARHDLQRVRFFETCVDGKSETWAGRIKRTGSFVHRDQMAVIKGCDLSWTGETLVRGIGLTPEVAVRAWLDSPSHRAVILKPRARWAGIGVRVDSDGRTIGVLNFGDAS